MIILLVDTDTYSYMTKPQQEGPGKEPNATKPGAGAGGKADEDHPVVTHYTDASSGTIAT